MFPIKSSWNFMKFDMLHMELNFKTARVRYNDIKYFLKESINHWNGIEIYYRFILSFFDHFPLKYFSNFSFWSLSFFSFMSFSFDFFKNFISWAFSFWSFSYQGHFHGHRYDWARKTQIIKYKSNFKIWRNFFILFIKKTTSVSGGGWLRTLEFYVKSISP